MDDNRIVELYWQRDESAIPETQLKYGRYCYAIAHAILGNREDSEECVNDTYFNTWNAIPPHRPQILYTFLGKITRRLALKKLRNKNALKRGGQAALALDELNECISFNSVEKAVQTTELAKAIDGFLAAIPLEDRRIFVCRYWYCETIRQIARRFGCGQSKVKMTLKRTREKLLEHLKKEDLF